MFNLLVQYGQRNGHCNVPAKWKEVLPNGESVNLGNWVVHQRQKKDRSMTTEHRDRLQQLVDQGLFTWGTTHQRREWDFMYDLLVDYGQRNGTCNVPKRWKEVLADGDEVNLGKWVADQRWRRDTIMTQEHRTKLEALVEQGLFKWRMKE